MAVIDKPDRITGRDESAQPRTKAEPTPGTGPLSTEEHKQMMEARPKARIAETPEEHLHALVTKGIKGDPTHRPSYPNPLLKQTRGGAVAEGPYRPPADLNPDMLTKGIEHFDAHSGYAQCAVDAFSRSYVGLQKISDAKAQIAKDPSKTEAQQVLMLAGEAEKLQNQCTRLFDDAHKRLTENIQALDDMLNGPLTHKADNTLSGELRALCRSMTNDERAKFISDAMRDRDMPVLTAILGGHPALSGLTKDRQAHLKRQFNEATNPEVTQRLGVMRAALEYVDQRGSLVIREVERALGAKWDTVQKLRAASSASEAALLLINNPVA